MLLAESRTSFTDIARECKITVGAVRMRYKRLWKDGVINGEVMLVNPHRLGYRHIVDLGITVEPADEKDVQAFLETKSYISEVVYGHLGRYAFYGKAALRDLNRLSEIIEDLESNSKVKHVDAIIWSEAVHVEFPQNLVIKPLKNGKVYQRPALTNIDKIPTQLDEIDKKIAVILTIRARMPFRKIAEQLGISTKTVIQRYKKLRENLLTVSAITVDLNKLGYNALANLYIKVSNRSKMTEIYNELLKIPNVIVIIRLINYYDLYVAVVLEDFASFFATKEKISTISGLEKLDDFIVPVPPVWPFNLFAGLLENEALPKFWPGENKGEPTVSPVKKKSKRNS